MRAFYISIFLVQVTRLLAQQVADTLFNPPIPDPVYAMGSGSVIYVDEAHRNFHTIDGRFKPFAKILSNDGYVVKGFRSRFVKAALSEGKILVIANALHTSNQGNWSLPTPSAFTDEEIAVLNTWVKDGGSLFLICDHMPFPGANEKLAQSFGFKFYNGFAMKKKNNSKDIFTLRDGLKETPLTKGRNDREAIHTLQTFTGQAFEIPPQAQPVVVLNADYEMIIPKTAWVFDRESVRSPADNLVQGAFMNYGKGRVVVFGEAAMFTAQLQGKNKFGMNGPDAHQNLQFLLNTIHWLDKLIN